MSSSKVTLWGFNDYLSYENKSIFDKLVIPSSIDRNTLIDTMLIRSNEFESLYSNPFFLIDAIGAWSKKMYPTFDRWAKAITNSDSFNPLENYDRIEDITRRNTGTVKNVGSGSNTGTVKNNGSESNTGTVKNTGTETNIGNSTETIANGTTNKVSAFDSDTLRVNTSDDTTGSDTIQNSGTKTDDLTRTDNLQRKDESTRVDDLKHSDESTRTDNLEEKVTSRIHGNIGVTSLAKLWTEYNEAVLNLNIYDQIADLFVSEFCIMVY